MRIRVGVKDGDIAGGTGPYASGRALQIAADALAARGGGVLEIGPGVYEMQDALHLRSHVRVTGAGSDTVLRKCDGPESALLIDADYGQLKLTPERPDGFRVGMAVQVLDDASGGWHTSTSRIVEIVDGVLYIADHLVNDYSLEKNARVSNATSLVSAVDVEDVVIEGLLIDGNQENNSYINGCRGGGIYLHKAKRCRVVGCTVRRFNGDGISWQITQDVCVEGCTVEGGTGLGLHPGTGSARTVIRGCRARANGEDGLFLCWRVQDGVIEDCEITANGRHGISIGHKDTGNLFRRNVVSANGRAGIHFREEKESNAGSRNRFEGNTIESNGREAPSPAVEILGVTSALSFVKNVIRPGEGGQRVAFFVGPRAEKPELEGNEIAAHPDGEVETAAGE